MPDMWGTYAELVHPGEHRLEIRRGPEPPVRRSPARFIGPTVMTVGAMIAIVASFAPWLQSGAVARSSYDLLGLVHLLHIAHHGLVRGAIRVWPLMPLSVIAAVVAAWWGWRYIAAALGLLGGMYAGGLSAAVALAIHDRYTISVTAAPTWTAIGSGIVIIGSLIVLFVRVPPADSHGR